MTKIIVGTFILFVWAGSSLTVYKSPEAEGLWATHSKFERVLLSVVAGPMAIGSSFVNLLD